MFSLVQIFKKNFEGEVFKTRVEEIQKESREAFKEVVETFLGKKKMQTLSVKWKTCYQNSETWVVQ